MIQWRLDLINALHLPTWGTDVGREHPQLKISHIPSKRSNETTRAGRKGWIDVVGEVAVSQHGRPMTYGPHV